MHRRRPGSRNREFRCVAQTALQLETRMRRASPSPFLPLRYNSLKLELCARGIRIYISIIISLIGIVDASMNNNLFIYAEITPWLRGELSYTVSKKGFSIF